MFVQVSGLGCIDLGDRRSRVRISAARQTKPQVKWCFLKAPSGLSPHQDGWDVRHVHACSTPELTRKLKGPLVDQVGPRSPFGFSHRVWHKVDGSS